MKNENTAHDYRKDDWTIFLTGGGCEALGKELPNDAYMLITDEWGVTIDGNMETDVFMLGIYTNEGDELNAHTGTFAECIKRANAHEKGEPTQ